MRSEESGGHYWTVLQTSGRSDHIEASQVAARRSNLRKVRHMRGTTRGYSHSQAYDRRNLTLAEYSLRQLLKVFANVPRVLSLCSGELPNETRFVTASDLPPALVDPGG